MPSPSENKQEKVPANRWSTLTTERPTESQAIQIPQISLPKGGGAIRGIDEKFQVNPSNGTASFSVPLPFSPNRNGFTPSLSISYNSGAGNSILGIGWSLDFPSIQRKTDKMLPRYRDFSEGDEDTFMFSGVEDLVPLLEWENGSWKKAEQQSGDYLVQRYRPRIEGSFSRIERITHPLHGTYWRVTTRENVTTIFGRSKDCRIADPQDKRRIFQWLPELSFDDKGSLIVFQYKAEDAAGWSHPDGSAKDVFDKNRLDENGQLRLVNRYLKRVLYGNAAAFYPYEQPNASPFDPPAPGHDFDWHFELVLDFGEHAAAQPTPGDAGTWALRPDPFSSHRSGFEIRTCRLLKRVLMFHRFAELNGGMPTLVRSTDFKHLVSDTLHSERETELEFLESITQSGYIWLPAENRYAKKSLPPQQFSYQPLTWNREIREVGQQELVHAPVGLSANYQWTDLYSEGINGILTEQAGGWFYKHNLGDLTTNEAGATVSNGKVRFEEAKLVLRKPSLTGLSSGVLQLQDLEARGEKQLVVSGGGLQGFFEMTDAETWQPFRAFLKTANVNLRDPNVRLLDLNGDGLPDIVMTEELAFVWFPNAGKIGYDAPELAPKPFDEEQGPAIIFADAAQSIFLADMSGDGLTDVVRIRNGEVCYWSNLGHGRFGRKVTMSNAPLFDHPDSFNPAFLQLADLSGTGATDLVYLGQNRFRAWLNLGGNRWGQPQEIEPFFPLEKPNKITVTDLLGNGTGCLVWSSELPGYGRSPMRYMDLMGGKKPHIMTSYRNNSGKQVTTEYKSSTFFYLKDKLAGTPWATKLPFPVQVVAKTAVEEQVSGLRFATEYSYHHGCYDPAEREFRGFGRVEQTDTETFGELQAAGAANGQQKELHQPPVLTKTWFHTGVGNWETPKFEGEYWHQNPALASLGIQSVEAPLPEARVSVGEHIAQAELPAILAALSAEEWREAMRACKGMTLRQEVFALDAPVTEGFSPPPDALKKQATPYSVATHNCEVQLIQARSDNRFAVFTVKENEALTYHYERRSEDPRISHTLNIEVDQYGNVLQAVSVVYPRLQNEPELNTVGVADPKLRACLEQTQAAQKQAFLTFTKNRFTEDTLQGTTGYRLPKLWETQTFELSGFEKNAWLHEGKLQLFKAADFKNALAMAERPYHLSAPLGAGREKRLIEHVRTLFLGNDLKTPLPAGRQGSWGLPYEAYQLAYTPALLADIFKSLPTENTLPVSISEADLDEARFEKMDGNCWIRSGRMSFLRGGEALNAAKMRFLTPLEFTDPFGSKTSVEHDPHTLFIRETTDVLGNTARVSAFDYRSLSPLEMQDPNGDRSAVLTDELGLPKAMAVMGKGNEADSTDGLLVQETSAEKLLRQAFWQAADSAETDSVALHEASKTLLGKASARFIYDFERIPLAVASISREEHHRVLETENRLGDLRLQITIEYSDGLGKVAMKKVQAEPGMAKKLETLPDGSPLVTDIHTGNRLRWVGNGRTVFNNKGNPILQYEPYFAASAGYEDAPALVERGVFVQLTYDPMGRAIRTDMPDGTFSRVEFDAWKQRAFDPNDTVKDSRWYEERFLRKIDAKLLAAGKDPLREQQAAQQAAAHHGTAATTFFDALGRPTLGVDHNGFDAVGKPVLFFTRVELDIEGNVRSVLDARFNRVMAYRYDCLGHRIFQDSMDAGKRWMFNNALGNPVKSWDQRLHLFTFEYDALHRPVSKKVQGGDGATPLNHTYERIFYGENMPNDSALRLRGKPVVSFDTAGKVHISAYDEKGNALETSRQLLADRKATPNWSANTPVATDALNLLETERFISRTRFDAMSRPVQQIAPKSDRAAARFNVLQSEYNPAGLLEKTHTWLQVPTAPGSLLDPATTTLHPVRNIDYNEKGQRTKISYGNGVSTRYEYDPENFRLLRLRSTPLGGGAGGVNAAALLQDLRYTYDPTGNITQLGDAAIPTVFFNNFAVEAVNTYAYDALYRLTSATGREHAGQLQHGTSDNWNDLAFLQKHHVNDALALRPYTERYEYDPVGNLLKMKHLADGGGAWTRRYEYEPDNNRLRRTWMKDTDAPALGDDIYTYLHHAQHGFLTALPHLNLMQWNFREELQTSANQAVAPQNGNPETTRYQYDAAGQRSRKSQLTPGGSLRYERIYLGGFELYREFNGGALALERETLHLMDGEQRIALVEQRTLGDDGTEQTLIRYQHGNHLGSASLETNETGQIVSYEEFHPYGTTAFQAVNAAIRSAAKRYRYTGMERDEETGLEYHAARYYLPWLGRWASADPIGVGDGVNVYGYGGNNPIKFKDNTGTTITVMPSKAHDVKNNADFSTGQQDANKFFLRDIQAGLKPGEERLFSINSSNQLAYSGQGSVSQLSEMAQLLIGQINATQNIQVMPVNLSQPITKAQISAVDLGTFQMMQGNQATNGLILKTTPMQLAGSIYGSTATGQNGDIMVAYITGASVPSNIRPASTPSGTAISTISGLSPKAPSSQRDYFLQGHITQTLTHELAAHVEATIKGEQHQDSHFEPMITTRNRTGYLPSPAQVLANTSLAPFERSARLEKEVLSNLSQKITKGKNLGGDPMRRDAHVALIKQALQRQQAASVAPTPVPSASTPTPQIPIPNRK